MFTHSIFSVYDSKANLWHQPFFARNAAVASRMFEQAVNDPATEFHKFAGDYVLFEIGEWNENEGQILGEVPKNLGIALSFLKVKE